MYILFFTQFLIVSVINKFNKFNLYKNINMNELKYLRGVHFRSCKPDE